MILVILACASLLAWSGPASPEPPAGSARFARPKTVSFTLEITGETGGQTGPLTVTCLVPKTLPGRQEVLKIQYAPPASRMFDRDGDRFAVFELEETPSRFRFTMRIEMKLYPSDFQSARKQAKARKKARRKARKKGSPAKEQDMKPFLQPEPGIESDHPAILALARDVKARTAEKKVGRIHALVLEAMRPGPHRGDGRGAAASLKARKGDCCDYADLFVALCRACGIPARYVVGYTVPYDDGPEYAWPEAYVKNLGWVTFDPLLAEFGSASFEKIENRIVVLSHHRRCETLEGDSFWHHEYAGESLKIRSRIVVH